MKNYWQLLDLLMSTSLTQIHSGCTHPPHPPTPPNTHTVYVLKGNGIQMEKMVVVSTIFIEKFSSL